MIDRIDVQPDDRFLLLSIHEPSLIVQLAARLPAGLIVGLGADEEVRAARRQTRDLDNVMLVPATPDDIPWQDRFFTKAVDLICRWERPAKAAGELARVLVKGGGAYMAGPEATAERLFAAGFTNISSSGELLIARLA